MGNYVSAIGTVSAKVPKRTIDGSSDPTSTEVLVWVDDVEAIADGYLAAAGISPPVTSTRGIKILRGLVATRVAGMVERAYSSIRNEGDEVGADRKDEFDEFFDRVRADPAWAKGVLGIDTGTTASGLRAYVTDNTDSKTVSAGDFDPEFGKDDEF